MFFQEDQQVCCLQDKGKDGRASEIIVTHPVSREWEGNTYGQAVEAYTCSLHQLFSLVFSETRRSLVHDL